ncbi:hypothetical protein PI124_g14652 [Phytophthora idaei]|nr:hypothetical protein PI125_g14340 [Phytophthora idaei]KAG3145988.1 hypothetical protein PI126_g13516 [Phytophthora idaei]KAG3240452.1 hypothetical protein PI124_g14652 [Phytophthora idaei]
MSFPALPELISAPSLLVAAVLVLIATLLLLSMTCSCCRSRIG